MLIAGLRDVTDSQEDVVLGWIGEGVVVAEFEAERGHVVSMKLVSNAEVDSMAGFEHAGVAPENDGMSTPITGRLGSDM